jgi:uncharacterized protein YndB with AHSA1/START domain
MGNMDDTFKALADPTRRSLLDALHKNDGQTLSALEANLTMTRFGVMKHLKILEAARLITTQKEGREKKHYLNAIPIRLIYERWVSKYEEPWAKALSNLKQNLEKDDMEKVFEIYIKTTPEKLWEAITNPSMRRKYTFGVMVQSDWQKGSRIEGHTRDMLLLDGEVLEVNPPHKLVQSYRAHWSEDVKAEGTSRVTWTITPVGDSCRLLVTHDQLQNDCNPEIYGGWPMILSGLKTLLETGQLLTTPGSLAHVGDIQSLTER